MEQNPTKTVAYFQWLRLFAALAVVLMHTAGADWSAISWDHPGWQTLTLWDSVVRWPVPVFVMITGAIFLPRTTGMKTVLTRYIPRMVLVFLLWSGVYALYHLAGGARAEDALKLFVAGEYHLWYLPFLCGVYLVIPFVQKIVTDPRLEDQLLATGLIIGLLLPWLADFGAALWPAGGYFLQTLKNHVNYTFFFDLLSMLVLGHWLHTRPLSRPWRWTLYTLGLLSVLLTGPATIWLTRRTGLHSSLFFGHGSPTTIFAAAAIFVFAKYNLTTLPKWVALPARWSFGVYLSHVLVLQILSDHGYHALTWNPLWAVPALAALVFAITLAATAILSRVPILGKYMT